MQKWIRNQVTPNDLDIKLIWEEIEVVMKLYSPREATRKAEQILERNKTKWKKSNQRTRNL